MSEAPRTYTRFKLPERIEHLVMVLSFTTLAITGLPQKYPTTDWADIMIGLFGGIELTRIIHRTAAIILLVGSVYHLFAVGYKVLVRRDKLTMLPTLRDGIDALQAFLHNIGAVIPAIRKRIKLARSRPQMGRYTFEEKAEYWALVWGTVVMVITGFMMWNPIATARFLPGEFIPAAKAAHGGEALLAVLAIIVWHMYGVHIRQFNKSMWTGKMTEEEMLHEHPLELADIKAGIAERPVSKRALDLRRTIYLPVSIISAAVMFYGIYLFVTFEETAITTVPPIRDRVEVFVPITPTPTPIPAPTATPEPFTGAVNWDNYVGALLKQKCGACHGSLGGLSLASFADAMKGGNSGPVIIPGDSVNSLLVTKIEAGTHPGGLSEDELLRIREWLNTGAPEK